VQVKSLGKKPFLAPVRVQPPFLILGTAGQRIGVQVDTARRLRPLTPQTLLRRVADVPKNLYPGLQEYTAVDPRSPLDPLIATAPLAGAAGKAGQGLAQPVGCTPSQPEAVQVILREEAGELTPVRTNPALHVQVIVSPTREPEPVLVMVPSVMVEVVGHALQASVQGRTVSGQEPSERVVKEVTAGLINPVAQPVIVRVAGCRVPATVKMVLARVMLAA